MAIFAFGRTTVKYSKTAEEVPTVPLTNDHNDGTWLATDIYEAEIFINLIDRKIYTRKDDEIILLTSYGVELLAELGDVDLTGLINGNILIWNSVTEMWEAGTPSFASGPWEEGDGGAGSIQAIDTNCDAQADYSLAQGKNVLIKTAYSFAQGKDVVATHGATEQCHSSGKGDETSYGNGIAQVGRFVYKCITEGATAVEAFVDVATSSKFVPLEACSYNLVIKNPVAVSLQSGGGFVQGESMIFNDYSFLLKSNSGITIVSSGKSLPNQGDASLLVLEIEPSVAGGELVIKCKGAANLSARWTFELEYTVVGFDENV